MLSIEDRSYSCFFFNHYHLNNNHLVVPHIFAQIHLHICVTNSMATPQFKFSKEFVNDVADDILEDRPDRLGLGASYIPHKEAVQLDKTLLKDAAWLPSG